MKASNDEFLRQLQLYIAQVSITASAVRLGGQKHKGVTGMARAARLFLRQLQLAAVSDHESYTMRLDDWTEELRGKFPTGGQYWGIARKCMNIFMRDVTYNVWLRRAYSLENLASALELPLDSYVRKGLRAEDGGQSLTKCNSVIGVTPEINAEYQMFATGVASARGVSRVDLDLWYFTNQG